jgi:hypothetical protein
MERGAQTFFGAKVFALERPHYLSPFIIYDNLIFVLGQILIYKIWFSMKL